MLDPCDTLLRVDVSLLGTGRIQMIQTAGAGLSRDRSRMTR